MGPELANNSPRRDGSIKPLRYVRVVESASAGQLPRLDAPGDATETPPRTDTLFL